MGTLCISFSDFYGNFLCDNFFQIPLETFLFKQNKIIFVAKRPQENIEVII